MRVLRIEHQSGKGPYTCFNVIVNPYGSDHRPSPWCDGKLPEDPKYRFGFKDADQLREWWADDLRGWDAMVASGEYSVVELEVRDDIAYACQAGNRQVVFEPAFASRITATPLSLWPRPCVDAGVGLPVPSSFVDAGPWPKQIDGLWVGDDVIPF